MKREMLIGLSIVTVSGILLAAVALGFGDTRPKMNPGSEISETDIKGGGKQAQLNVSFRILEPAYIPQPYKFENLTDTKFRGAMVDIDMVLFYYRDGDEQLTVKETMLLNTKSMSQQPGTFNDTREILDINGREGRYSEENGIKMLSWRIGNLSLSISGWKNEGANRTFSSISKDELIKMAGSVMEKTPEEAIGEAQSKVSFKILKPTYVPSGYMLNIPQVSGTKFRGLSLEADQAMLPYTKGNETLNLKELLILNDTTPVPKNTTVSEDTREIVDINGIKGRFSREADGLKYLNWKIGELSLTISSSTYNSNGITGSSLSKEEMIKMARSVR